MAKLTVHYNIRRIIEIDVEPDANWAAAAACAARNHAGDHRARVVQVLAEGVASDLLDDQPPEPTGPTRPLPPPPMSPLGAGGDQMLARAA